MRRRVRLLLLVPLFLTTTAQRSTLYVERSGRLVEWWSSDHAPARWTEPPSLLTDAFAWTRPQRGLEVGEAEIVVNRLLRLRVFAVRLDPRAFDLSLEHVTSSNGVTAAWSIRRAPAGAAFAVNAGQFEETGPWGWLVLNSIEMQYPGRGPLAMAIAADSVGLQWITDRDVFRWRATLRPRFAFQSYPLLIDSVGRVTRSTAQDVAHRDTRLAIGRLTDGRILFVLTRFGGGGRVLERLPAGLTTPEMAALMGALGARPALMLDGGLSAQMLVRDSAGATRLWTGGRMVPLALIATPRSNTARGLPAPRSN